MIRGEDPPPPDLQMRFQEDQRTNRLEITIVLTIKTFKAMENVSENRLYRAR